MEDTVNKNTSPSLSGGAVLMLYVEAAPYLRQQDAIGEQLRTYALFITRIIRIVATDFKPKKASRSLFLSEDFLRSRCLYEIGLPVPMRPPSLSRE